MNKRVTVAKRAPESGTAKSGQRKYVILGTFWMGETFNKGVKSMREGALDAYDTVMFRCRYNKDIDRWCLLQYRGKWYQITSLNEDYQENQLQITATELANQQVNIFHPREVEIWGNEACTERPNGYVRKVYAQFNKMFRYDVSFENEDFNFRIYYNYVTSGKTVAFNRSRFTRNIGQSSVIESGTVMQLDGSGTLDGSKNYSFGEYV